MSMARSLHDVMQLGKTGRKLHRCHLCLDSGSSRCLHVKHVFGPGCGCARKCSHAALIAAVSLSQSAGLPSAYATTI